MFDGLCANCDVCRFMPEQMEPRRLIIRHESGKARVLVVDDLTERGFGWDAAFLIIGKEIAFDYTKTVRCWYTHGDLTEAQQEEALQRCSVWTKNVAGNYAIYLCTEDALKQLGIGAERKPGDTFVNARLGLVLCIEPLETISPSTMAEYTTKFRRLLKKAGMDK